MSSHGTITADVSRRSNRQAYACVHCRTKKIKCDATFPKCTRCASAGADCEQQDLNINAIVPRGRVVTAERRVLQCLALLHQHYPELTLDQLDDLCDNVGISIEVEHPANVASSAMSHPHIPRLDAVPSPTIYAHTMRSKYTVAHNTAYTSDTTVSQESATESPTAFSCVPGMPHWHSSDAATTIKDNCVRAPTLGYMPAAPPQVPRPLPLPVPDLHHPAPDTQFKGHDPNVCDMSDILSLARVFGVSSVFTREVAVLPVDQEPFSVDITADELTLRLNAASKASLPLPREQSKWISIPTNHCRGDVPETFHVSLPASREIVIKILDTYFSYLNPNRPVLFRESFQRELDMMYDGQVVPYDVGFLCSTYLVFALGTLYDIKASGNDGDTGAGEYTSVPPLWPGHEEFFELVLVFKSHLSTTTSSLQALLLLYWYLYTTKQGNALRRLVGSIVRLAIELGLNHDPTPQNVFSEAECELRVRLWHTTLIYDRTTSLLLGIPLSVSPWFSNVPLPTNHGTSSISEHFMRCCAIAELRADLISSLCIAIHPTPDVLAKKAVKLIENMKTFCLGLPERFAWYISRTEAWSMENRVQLVRYMPVDDGLSLLDAGVTKLAIMRLLFCSENLQYSLQHCALVFAMILSHNVIAIYHRLMQCPQTTFFVSPAPLQMAVMVILYGHMSNCTRIPRQTALQDVHVALEILRTLHRQQGHGTFRGESLLTLLSEAVLGVSVQEVYLDVLVLLEEDEDVVANLTREMVHASTA
ncbi:fungal-specific transcription factor domain-containing protein [Trametes meyenii]|nr:fungal-specific transcription factor domain-containing protein [Trametes meyenii]KAI0649610.1 fungal-specific transcription factor domain-containing protein [Trametes meyenii]